MKRLIPGFILAAPLLLGACSMSLFHGSTKNPAVDPLRSQLEALKADSRLSSRVPVQMKEAEEAVTAAEEPQSDAALSTHLLYLADRKVQTAKSLAEALVAEDQLKAGP